MAKRRGVWVDTNVDIDIANGNSSELTLIGAYSPEQTHGMTLVRTLFQYSLFDATGEALDGLQRFYMGVGLAPQEAFVAGVASLPNPQIQGDRPLDGWILKTVDIAVSGPESAVQVTRRQMDVRASRKVDGGELYIVLRNSLSLGASFTVRCVGLMRMFILRP